MLNITEAIKVVEKNLPGQVISKYVEYKDLFIFQIFIAQPLEEGLDPFFSVNRMTGEFRDFSILTDGDPMEIDRLFISAKEN